MVARAISESEPCRRPGIQNPTPDAGLTPELCQQRPAKGAASGVLQRRLAGDLDNIVLKALRKDPNDVTDRSRRSRRRSARPCSFEAYRLPHAKSSELPAPENSSPPHHHGRRHTSGASLTLTIGMAVAVRGASAPNAASMMSAELADFAHLEDRRLHADVQVPRQTRRTARRPRHWSIYSDGLSREARQSCAATELLPRMSKMGTFLATLAPRSRTCRRAAELSENARIVVGGRLANDAKLQTQLSEVASHRPRAGNGWTFNGALNAGVRNRLPVAGRTWLATTDPNAPIILQPLLVRRSAFSENRPFQRPWMAVGRPPFATPSCREPVPYNAGASSCCC